MHYRNQYLGMEMGTQIKNPMRRGGSFGYSPCSGCGKYYTSMGISRHWPKCKELVPNERGGHDKRVKP